MKPPLLETVGLHKHYVIRRSRLFGGARTIRAVDGVSLRVAAGETLGLVGESGCGKSTLARCLVRLLDITSGQIRLDGVEIGRLGQRALRPLRRRMQMIFQDPYASLNPRRLVGELIAEPLRVHGRPDVAGRVQELLRLVGLSPEHLQRYPHEFSGGQRQRIGIARALALEPALIVADEPVSALDVSVQAQIINLFVDLRERLNLTYVFIAHDLSVVRHISHRTAVMYLGAIVEIGPTDEVYSRPAHPYTEALLAAQRHATAVPDRSAVGPSACRFSPRCRYAAERCRTEPPGLRALDTRRSVACHFPRG